jgi:thiol-disulfide isomerase/thioredoxin
MRPTRRCGHCKSIKPDWDKLIADFEGSSDKMVADVDCTAEGEPLCAEFGIQGFPTLKWGDPSDLQDYNGGRSYEDLKQFADENLK